MATKAKEKAKDKEKAKVVLVTGAARGIGRGIALRLAKDGCDLCLVDLPSMKKQLEGVVKEVKDLGRNATGFHADVTVRDQVFAAVDHAEKELGGFDVIVNNAGIAGKPGDGLLDATPKDVETIFKVNVNGVLWGIQAAAEKFLARGQKGKIISASSIAGHDAFPQLGLYSATKFAVRALTQAAARELGPKGITVNAYCPGIVDTDMWELIDAGIGRTTGAKKRETFEAYCKTIALGRPQYPEDVAAYVSFLVGPDSDYMTGQAVLIDGGMVYR
ncbi:MAG: acetoin reductase [Desulfovibrio sp.]|jgi:meso-butanediol dehydrogenase/(S,S)-butanediol dehydrogenase/diacetyl reductase|nr:acetoin reductase [Desulfovibrio sp.]